MIERSGRRISIVSTLPIVAALLACAAFAQTPPPPTPPAAASLTFEVATVKPNTSGSGGSHTGWNGKPGVLGDTYTAVNVTLKNLMQYQAFAIPEPRILGGPKWLDSARFDIEAKMDSATVAQFKALPRDQFTQQRQLMFQQLLADRFQLKTHWETRELPVYALVVANPKTGPTLEKAKDPVHGLGTSAGTGQLQANGATLADIAEVMTQEASDELGRVVIDKTGIEGRYDIRLKWTPDIGADVPAPAGSAPGPSIFTAIQEQLGLKLESSKGPVRVLVVDRAEMPSDN
jgi:uncharacterized protein (TIGR03435 family)